MIILEIMIQMRDCSLEVRFFVQKKFLLQENMMEHQIEEFRRLAERKREELEKKKRVVLLASSCLGILFVLILL